MLSALATGHKVGIAVVAGVFIAFALAASFLLPARRPQFPGRHVRLFVVVTVLLTAGMLATVIALAGEPKEARETEGATTEAATTQPAPSPSPAPSSGDATAGKAVFESAGCTSCHTLKAAGATGTVGPNLDEAKPSADLVVERVTNGRGVMPSFKGQLTPKQIQDVAAFVSSAAGR